MIISVDGEKAFDKNSSIYDKNFPESDHRENLPQHNKRHLQQTHNKH